MYYAADKTQQKEKLSQLPSLFISIILLLILSVNLLAITDGDNRRVEKIDSAILGDGKNDFFKVILSSIFEAEKKPNSMNPGETFKFFDFTARVIPSRNNLSRTKNNRALTATTPDDEDEDGHPHTHGHTNSIVPLGLIGLWKFEDIGTTASDSSPSGFNGTLVNGANWTAGKIGNGILLDGINDYVNIGNQAPYNFGTNDFSITGWFRTAISNTENGYLISKRATCDYGSFYNVYVRKGRFAVELNQSNSTNYQRIIAANNVVNNDLFHHFAVVRSGATTRLYVDGTQAVSSIAPGGAMLNLSNTASLSIGNTPCSIYAGERTFPGVIDEVRIYNRAISAGEVTTIFNATTPPPPDTSAPTTPTNVTATAVSTSQINLAWSVSFDDTAVTGYKVFRDGNQVGTTASPNYNDTGLLSATGYSYVVSAYDAAGNESAPSTPPVNAVTAAADTTAPVISNVANTVTAVTATITWDTNEIATSQVDYGLTTAYGSSTTLDTTLVTNHSQTISGLTPNTLYHYRVQSRDAAGNPAVSGDFMFSTPDAGLVGHWKFDENSGPTTADSSGQGFSGTLTNGPAWTNGRVNGGLLFDGINDYVNIGNQAPYNFGTNDFSITGWFRTAISNTENGYLISKRPNCNYGNFYNIYVRQGKVAVEFDQSDGSNYQRISGTNPVNNNQFQHFAIVRSGATTRLYVNGTQEATGNAPGNLTLNISNAASLSIGNTPCSIYAGERTFPGIIDEVRIYNRAISAGEVTTIFNATTPPPPDTSAPTVPTNPVAAAISTNQISFSWTASMDNVFVTGYKVFRDGIQIGTSVTTSYLDSGLQPATTYSYTVSAYDAAGNDSPLSAPAIATTPNPATVGQWSSIINFPLVAVHMMLAHTGEILMWDGIPINGGSSMRLWNPAANTFTSVPLSGNDAFCAGQTILADGRLLVMGGHNNYYVGTKNVNLFNPVTRTWAPSPYPQMSQARWYGTSTTLSDGKVLFTSGSTTCSTCLATIPEVFNPTNNAITQLTGAAKTLPLYPWMYNLPDGRVLYAGSDEFATNTEVLDVNAQTWTVVDSRLFDAGTSVMYQPGKVMKTGLTTRILDMTQTSPAWQQTASMNTPRNRDFHLTLLPDGTVMAIGGINNNGNVYASELWSSATQIWTPLAPVQIYRRYHSSALLLPDGRVLTAGSGRDGTVDQLNAEIFSPPYLFKGARPTISSAPAAANYNNILQVATPDGARIAKVSLVRTGADTHSYDQNQRFVGLSFQQNAGGLDVQTPANSNIAPPGYYMLFIIDTNGVPSIASFIKLQ